jgi:hypothetical protein
MIIAKKYTQRILGCILLMGLISCITTKPVHQNAYLIVQLRDQDTNQEIGNTKIVLLVDNKYFVYDGNNYEAHTDIQGQAQFKMLPKLDFTIEVPETDSRNKYSETIYASTLNLDGHNEMVILLSKKKTVFSGKVLDEEDNKKIPNARIQLTENYSTNSDASGQFNLEVPVINKDLTYTLNVSKLPKYYTTARDIATFKINQNNDLGTIFLYRTPQWVPEVTIEEGALNDTDGEVLFE